MSHLHYIIDAENHAVAVDLMTWARWFEDADRRVGWTQITSQVWVSTVFLGLDHQYGRGPPLLFETMVFNGPLDQSQWRYSSWDDAMAGHKAAVRKARAAQKQKVK